LNIYINEKTTASKCVQKLILKSNIFFIEERLFILFLFLFFIFTKVSFKGKKLDALGRKLKNATFGFSSELPEEPQSQPQQMNVNGLFVRLKNKLTRKY
jgi:hypothetical protein